MPTEQEIKELAFTAKLIEALRPLAVFAVRSTSENEKRLMTDRNNHAITVGDCRRAKELIDEWERSY